METNNSWKQKSAALTLAVSMVIVNPIALSGCSSSNNAQLKNAQNQTQNVNNDKDKDKEDEEQNSSGGSGGSSSVYYHSSSPFRFSSSGKSKGTSTISTDSTSSWHAWTTPSSSGGYSGVHAGSVSG